ncbi:MAG: hypothetical protein B7C24_14660 [Bacteroidetes bacterium 4572_77]|nr:MAG: hypothetical protein B7C24_14660 [Bacteroidetes bacterium 4572_77]
MNYKNIFSLFVGLVFLLNVNGQEAKTRKEIRAQKKADLLLKNDSVRQIQEQWAANKTFVLEAQQVYNKIGEVFQLSPSLNFVYFNLEEAVVQLSFNGIVGWNGVGGITIKGRITKYEYEADNKNIPIYIEATIQGQEGFQDILVWISTNGNGEAQVTDLRGNRLKFTGEVVSLEQSRVFMGTQR